MATTTYDFTENSTKRDTSYRSFICALLCFLAICLVIMLMAIFLKKGSGPEGKDGESLGLKGGKISTTTTVTSIMEGKQSSTDKNLDTTTKIQEPTTLSSTKTMGLIDEDQETLKTTTMMQEKIEGKQGSLGKYIDTTTMTPAQEPTASLKQNSSKKYIDTTPMTKPQEPTTSSTKSTMLQKDLELPKMTTMNIDTTTMTQSEDPTTINENSNTFSTMVPKIDQEYNAMPVTTPNPDYSNDVPEYEPEATKNPNDLDCFSPKCKQTSSEILAKMDHSEKNYCGSFYQFVCGNFEEAPKDDVFEKEIGQSQTMNEFYQSCLKYDDFFNYSQRMERVDGLIKEIGQFHFDDNNLDAMEFTNLVADLVLRQSMPLFDFTMDVAKDTFILQLTLPGHEVLKTSLENWSGLSLMKQKCLREQEFHFGGSNLNLDYLYESFSNCQKNFTMYLDSIEAVIRDLAAFQNSSAERLKKEIQDIRFDIEFHVLDMLKNVPSPDSMVLEVERKNNTIMDLDELQKKFPLIQWSLFLERLTGHSGTRKVQVYFVEFFEKLFNQFKTVLPRKLNNALLAIHSYDIFLNTVIGKKTKESCKALTKTLYPDLWAKVVQKSLPKKSKFKRQIVALQGLFKDLKSIFEESLRSMNWNSTDLITSLEFFTSDMVLDVPSPKLVLSNFQNVFIKTLMSFRKSLFALEGADLAAKYIFSYFLDPFGTELLTFYSTDIIFVPLGLVNKLDFELPEYITKIWLGFPLAREIARHYHTHFRPNESSTYSSFIESMTTQMDHWSPTVFDKNLKIHLNGALSLNERIVDNTAFRLLYESVDLELKSQNQTLPWISTQFNWREVFFVVFFQELCEKTSIVDFMVRIFEGRRPPAVLRVANMIANSDRFSQIFGCPEGSVSLVIPEKLQFPFLIKEEEEE